jgi:PAS domain S-box-containing protein
MKIRTRVKIAGAVALCVILAYGAWSVHLHRTMGKMTQEVKETNEIVNRIFWLRALTYDYLSFPTERAQKQWSALYEELRRLLDTPEYRLLQSKYGIEDTADKLKIVGDTFSRLMTIKETPGQGSPEAETRREFHSRLTTQLLLAAQDMVTRTFKMTEEIDKKLVGTQRLMYSLDFVAMLVLGAIIISTGVFLQRSVVKPVLKLHEGTEIIGAGNLNFKVGVATGDEIGALSQAFDRMTANLQQITVSRDDLAAEVEERKRAEEALRESEEHYRSLFDHMLDGFAYCRMHFEQNRPADFTYLKVNESFGTLTGLKNVTGKKVSEVIPGIRESNPELFEIYGRVARTGKPERFETYLDPLKMWLSVSVYSPRKDYFVAVFDVITARKQAEQELKNTLKDLERSNRDLEEFAFVASHDLQEPLRKIANFSEMLAEQYRGRFDEDADRYFGYVVDGAKRMQALINDLLSYSRVGRADLSLIPASLEDILQGTLNDLQSSIQESGAHITHDPLPVSNVNSYRMGQLLQNLLANAIKFHGDSSPRIHISARQEAGEWVIAVRDEGIGFDSQHAERIFKVFQRLHAKGKYPGTGIGLAICKKIVERHGGRCWAESQPGCGATFYFTIPA